jgi:hypothetical protein
MRFSVTFTLEIAGAMSSPKSLMGLSLPCSSKSLRGSDKAKRTVSRITRLRFA